MSIFSKVWNFITGKKQTSAPIPAPAPIPAAPTAPVSAPAASETKPPPPESGAVLGVDVSHYEPSTNMHQLAAAGMSFVFMKATEGLTYVDPKFREFWAAAKAAGIMRGAYHFLHCGQSGRDQAQKFLATVGELQAGDLPLCVDWESAGFQGKSNTEQLAVLKEFIDAIEEKSGLVPFVYIGSSHMREVALPAWLARYPLWVAQYTSAAQPTIAKPFTKWTIWQKSDKAAQHGVASGGDFDVFNGTLAELRSMTKQVVPLTKA